MIYLDNASTTPIDHAVIDSMLPFLTNKYGNAGGLYKIGRESREAIDDARDLVARFMGTTPEHIFFTSGGTEANSTAIHSVLSKNSLKKGREIYVSAIEHDSVIRAANLFGGEFGVKTKFIPVNSSGIVTAGNVVAASGKDTDMIAVMYSNNEIGSINKVKMIGEICKTAGIPFLCDCVQAAGCLPIKVDEMNCDFASISGHKIHAPKGVGALYVRDLKNFRPLIIGGSSQEFGMRGGTENVAGIVGLGKACEILMREGHLGERITNQKEIFWMRLNQKMQEYGIQDRLHDNASSSTIRGKTLSFRIDGVDAETMVVMADSKGLCISAGSACSSREQHPSHVLKGIGLSDTEARETVRVSFSRIDDGVKVREGAEIIADIANKLISCGAEMGMI